MANHLIAHERAEKRRRALQWLEERGLLAQLPSAAVPPTDAQRALLRQTVGEMLNAGLYSRTSDFRSLCWGVRRLVSEGRGEMVIFSTRHLS